MIADIRKHADHFSVLALLFSLGLILLVVFRHSLFIQQIVVWLMCVAYAVWGVVHHLFRRDLTGFIVLEYLLVAGLAGILLQSVLTAR